MRVSFYTHRRGLTALLIMIGWARGKARRTVVSKKQLPTSFFYFKMFKAYSGESLKLF